VYNLQQLKTYGDFCKYSSILLFFTANSLLFIDLYCTIRNPFYPRKKRAKAHNILLFIVAAGLIPWMFSDLKLYKVK